MADPAYKVSFIFANPVQTLGWVENLYLTAVDPDQAMQKAINIGQGRCSWLMGPLALEFIRVSANLPLFPVVPPPPRRQRMAFLQRVSLQGSYGGSGGSDVSWNAAKIRYADATGFIFRTQLSRGLPDIFWDGNTDKVAIAAFKTILPPYLKILKDNDVFINHVDPGPPRVFSPQAVKRLQYEGLSRRATGRPLLLPRGRRAAG